MKVYIVRYLDCIDGISFWNNEKVFINEAEASNYCTKMNMETFTHYSYEEYELE